MQADITRKDDIRSRSGPEEELVVELMRIGRGRTRSVDCSRFCFQNGVYQGAQDVRVLLFAEHRAEQKVIGQIVRADHCIASPRKLCAVEVLSKLGTF